MAVEEHLDVLRQGVEAWNAWQRRNRDIQPALSRADLAGADLAGAELYRADLSRANLAGANLAGARLVKTSLTAANLAGAVLTGAVLTRADLSRVDLAGARLAGVRLVKTSLTTANLTGAVLTGAILSAADLSRANLSEASLADAHLAGAVLAGASLVRVSLHRATLTGANLAGADLRRANLSGADLRDANLSGANLRDANLSGANLSQASLFRADLAGANLAGARLFQADLSRADLSRAILAGADLARAILIETNFVGADLTGCRVYGIAVWGLKLERAKQESLIVTPHDQPGITVDDLAVAQFIYLLLHNEKIRRIIDTITSKVVLLLGRFTPERKAVLDALREELRQRDYLPVLFDFDKPASRDLTGTVSTLARLARFIVADLTDPSSIPYELATVIPSIVVPVQPVLLAGKSEFAMFADLRARHHWVLATYVYASADELIATLPERVIHPAEAKALELRGVKPPG